jgi:hypothetical protein
LAFVTAAVALPGVALCSSAASMCHRITSSISNHQPCLSVPVSASR